MKHTAESKRRIGEAARVRKKYDAPENLYIYPNRNAAKHRECYASYKRQHYAGD